MSTADAPKWRPLPTLTPRLVDGRWQLFFADTEVRFIAPGLGIDAKGDGFQFEVEAQAAALSGNTVLRPVA